MLFAKFNKYLPTVMTPAIKITLWLFMTGIVHFTAVDIDVMKQYFVGLPLYLDKLCECKHSSHTPKCLYSKVISGMNVCNV